MHLVELPGNGMEADHHATPANERSSSVHVEEVAKTLADHQYRVHDGIDVVRADVRKTGEENVRLTVDLHGLLAVDGRKGAFMHRFRLAGVHPRDAVRSSDPRKEIPLELGGHATRDFVGG